MGGAAMGGGMGNAELQKAASQDPQTVFLAELLGCGLCWLPGIGHLIIGDLGFGLALLIGYPMVCGMLWTVLSLVTCGIGAMLIFLQWPINFLVGYFTGQRAKQKVIEAKRALGQPV